MLSSNDIESLRAAVQAEAATLLDDPDVTEAGVWFDVVDGATVGGPTVRVRGHRDVAGRRRRPTERRVDRRGFDTRFLTHPVPVPTVTGAAAEDLVLVDGSSVVDYTHFSLTMSRSRRFARWVAWNVDGGSLRKLSRSGLKFRLDPRVPADAQVGDEVYADNRLDRGHIARRADLTWGEPAEAAAANVDSFYFTNISPQIDDFNQSAREGVWGRIENAVYDEVDVDDLRISVFGGPVFHDDDRVYRGVALPVEFWKVVVFVEEGQLKARAFLLTQNLDRLAVLALDEFRAYQVDIATIAARTGLDFGPALTEASGPTTPSLTALRPLDDVGDIRW